MPLPFHSQVQILVPAGTAPLSIVSTTLVDNLNADLLDGQHGSYYAAASSLANYLPLTGGTLTGGLTGTTASFTGDFQSGGAIIRASASTAGHAWLSTAAYGVSQGDGRTHFGYNTGTQYENYIRGAHTVVNGSFQVVGAVTAQSTLAVTGAITQNGNQVLHAGNYSSYALPLSGGTLTGELAISTGTSTGLRVNAPSGTQSFWLRVGYDTDGTATPVASALNTMLQSSGSSAGTFTIVCGNTKTATLSNTAANFAVALQQGGNQVLHAGNVSAYALPIGGGTVTGNLTINGTLTEGGYLAFPERVYTVDLTAQSAANFYPIVINGAPGSDNWHHRFSLEMPSLGGASAYNMHHFHGEARGGGWSDQTAFYRVFHNCYQDEERSVLGLWRGTQNWFGIVIYVRGGQTYYVRTNSRSVTGYTSAVTLNSATFAIKNAAGADVSGTSANIGEMFNAINTPQGFHSSYNNYIGGTQVVTNTGTGASGTWGISISGSAVSATTQSKSDSSTSIATTAFSKWLFATFGTGGTTDWNHVSNTMPGTGTTLLLGNATNGFGPSQYYHPVNFEYAGTGGTGNVTQLAVAYGLEGNDLRMRGRYSGTWTSWVQFLNSSNFSSYALPITGGSVTGPVSIIGQTVNGQSHYQWEGATFRNPGDWTASQIIRRDNATAGINGSIPALVLYNNNGGDQTTVGLSFASAEGATGQGNAVALAGIIARKEGAGTVGNWSSGSLTIYVKNAHTRVDALNITSTGTVNALVALQQAGNQVLHAGNVSTYAVPASTNVGNADLNQVYNSGLYGFDVPTNSPGFSYGHLLVMRGRGDTIAQLAIDYATGQTSFRAAYLPNGSSTVGAAWSTWRRALDDGNYNSYAPTLTGTGASGTWNINISGSAAQLNGQAASFYQNAGNLNAGTLPSARLSGSYTIDILGASSSGSRLGLWDGTSYITGSNTISGTGGRGVNLAPNTYVKQISFEFKNTSFASMGGNYGGLITIAPWDGTAVSQGDPNYQLLFSASAANSTSNPVLRLRAGIDAGWGAWATLIHDANFSTAIPNSGVTAGTYNNVTVNAKGIVTGGSNVSYLTGNQSITLSGDVSGSGATAIAVTIGAGAVTYAKIQNVAISSVLGNSSASVVQAPQALSMATLAGMLSGQTMNIAGSSTSCTGNAATATTATNSTQLNGQAASYYENRDTTAVSISAGTLTLTRAAGNLTATIGGRVVAWCEFNGNFASSQSPNAAFNVSSITKNATGDYTVNFTSALANANYVVSGTAQLDAPSPGQSVNNVFVAVPRRSGAKATGSCRIVCEYPSGLSLWDCGSVGVAFIAA